MKHRLLRLGPLHAMPDHINVPAGTRYNRNSSTRHLATYAVGSPYSERIGHLKRLVSRDTSQLFRNLVLLSTLSSAILGLMLHSWSLFGKSIALWLAFISMLHVVVLVKRARDSGAGRELEQKVEDYKAFHRRQARLRTRIEGLQERVANEDDPWRRAVIRAALMELHQLTDPYSELVFNPGELPDPPRLNGVEYATHDISRMLRSRSPTLVDELASLVEIAKRSYR